MVPAQLRDRSLVGGLMVAAAGAAGLTTMAPPAVQSSRDDGVAAILLLDRCHISVHTFPEEGLLMLDVLSHSKFDAAKVMEVFTRRMGGALTAYSVNNRGARPSEPQQPPKGTKRQQPPG